jgi:hypothetical protein
MSNPFEHAADPVLATPLGKLNLRNPLLTASGTCGYGEEYADVIDYRLLGRIHHQERNRAAQNR